MLQFAQPIWLYAMSGMVIPIAIHLWNVKQGKTLRVGSIALIEESSRQTSRNLKLTELLLLALRCLLIVLLSLLLAKPSWISANKKNGIGWMLMQQSEVQRAYQQYPNLIDSLIREGYDFHFLDPSFTKEKWPSALKAASDTSAGRHHNYWSLLQALDTRLPAGATAYIFARNMLRDLNGRRPALTHTINWLPIRTNQADSFQLVDAWTTADDSVHVVTAKSGDSILAYSQKVLAPGAMPVDGIQAQTGNNGTTVSYKEQHLTTDTSSMIITVFADKGRTDASYVIAAVNAIRLFTKKNIRIEVVSDAGKIPAFQHWLFWLSETPVQSAKSSGILFRYAQGSEQTVHSWIETGNNTAAEDIQLRKRILFEDMQSGDKAIWNDGYGSPLLVERKAKNTHVYEFYSRFNISWNDLGWSNAFPALLLDLILKPDVDKMEGNTIDNRRIDPSLLQFEAVNDPATKGTATSNSTELSNLAWLLICILFLLERWFSFRTKKVAVDW